MMMMISYFASDYTVAFDMILSIHYFIHNNAPNDIGSYGSTLRYKTVERLKSVGKHSVIGASGEISDFQEIMRYLDELM